MSDLNEFPLLEAQFYHTFTKTSVQDLIAAAPIDAYKTLEAILYNLEHDDVMQHKLAGRPPLSALNLSAHILVQFSKIPLTLLSPQPVWLKYPLLTREKTETHKIKEFRSYAAKYHAAALKTFGLTSFQIARMKDDGLNPDNYCTIDHIEPLNMGGPNNFGNLVFMPYLLNGLKGNCVGSQVDIAKRDNNTDFVIVNFLPVIHKDEITVGHMFWGASYPRPEFPRFDRFDFAV